MLLDSIGNGARMTGRSAAANNKIIREGTNFTDIQNGQVDRLSIQGGADRLTQVCRHFPPWSLFTLYNPSLSIYCSTSGGTSPVMLCPSRILRRRSVEATGTSTSGRMWSIVHRRRISRWDYLGRLELTILRGRARSISWLSNPGRETT